MEGPTRFVCDPNAPPQEMPEAPAPAEQKVDTLKLQINLPSSVEQKTDFEVKLTASRRYSRLYI